MMQIDILKSKQDDIKTSELSTDILVSDNTKILLAQQAVETKRKQLDITKLPCFKCEWRWSIHYPKCQWNKDGNINTY